MKTKELINDKRLTPTMERARSGRTQLFREKNNKDRSFISSKNCDISLTHQNKEMYAELIEGKWYWVSGCAECNGEPRDWMTYIECEKHDRCRTCGINRKDLKGVPWGGKRGWQCNSCKEEQDDKNRKIAFDKFKEEDPDEDYFSYMDEIKCPHCLSKVSNEEVHESQNLECGVCEGQLYVEVEYTPSYSTSIVGKRITE